MSHPHQSASAQRKSLILLVYAVLPFCFMGCAKAFHGTKAAGTVFRPGAKAAAKHSAQAFLFAYAGPEAARYQLGRTLYWDDTYWTCTFSDMGIDTSIYVDIEDGTGKGRIKGNFGNVLLKDNAYGWNVRHPDPFRTLEDFRSELAEQKVREKKR